MGIRGSDWVKAYTIVSQDAYIRNSEEKQIPWQDNKRRYGRVRKHGSDCICLVVSILYPQVNKFSVMLG